MCVAEPEAWRAVRMVLKCAGTSEALHAVQMVLKCADIGHLAASPRTHSRWAYQLEEVFFRQGDQERDVGLPVSPLMDRSTKGGMTRSQVGRLSCDCAHDHALHALSSVVAVEVGIMSLTGRHNMLDPPTMIGLLLVQTWVN